MRYTDTQIIKLSKEILKEIEFNDIDQNSFTARFESIEVQLEKAKSSKYFEEFKKIAKAYWVVAFDFTPEMEARIPTVFFRIYDESGTPFELQTWQALYKFNKKPDGKWEIK